MTDTLSGPIGLICAIPEEIAQFGASFREGDTRTLAGLTFRTGELDGRAAVLVEGGIGKVNAAVVATLLCQEFGVGLLLFSGVAGGLDPALGIGDVVIGTTLVQYDYGAIVGSRLKPYQPGTAPLPGQDDGIGYRMDPEVERRARAALDGVELPPLPARATGEGARKPRILFGTIVTGDAFVNCEATRVRLHHDFRAMAVEMEGAAIAQVAERYGVPFLVVRALSDLAGAESHMDFPSFVHAAAEGASILIRRLIVAL